MIQKYTEAGQIPNEQAKQMVLRDIIEPEIVSLDYVFDGLQFGGSMKSRKNKCKKSKKKSRKNLTNQCKEILNYLELQRYLLILVNHF